MQFTNENIVYTIVSATLIDRKPGRPRNKMARFSLVVCRLNGKRRYHSFKEEFIMIEVKAIKNIQENHIPSIKESDMTTKYQKLLKNNRIASVICCCTPNSKRHHNYCIKVVAAKIFTWATANRKAKAESVQSAHIVFACRVKDSFGTVHHAIGLPEDVRQYDSNSVRFLQGKKIE